MKTTVPWKPVAGIISLAVLFLFGTPDGFGIDTKRSSPDAPSLTADELSYGIEVVGDHKEITEKISVRLIDESTQTKEKKGKGYEIQCYFFKREPAAAPPSVYDAVSFEVPDLSKKYAVQAKNIELPKPPAKPKGSKHSKAKPAPTPNDALLPHFAGYCVNVLQDGKLLSQSFSTPEIRQVVEANPGILNPKSGRKIEGNASSGM